MQIHEKLKVLRQFKGWSQEKMAEELHCSVNRYARIERGEININTAKLERIAKVLGVDLQKLIGLNESNVFNLAENTHTTTMQCSIVLSETQCVHELERSRLLLQEREKEIGYLKEENAQLKEIIRLMKKDNSS